MCIFLQKSAEILWYFRYFRYRGSVPYYHLRCGRNRDPSSHRGLFGRLEKSLPLTLYRPDVPCTQLTYDSPLHKDFELVAVKAEVVHSEQTLGDIGGLRNCGLAVLAS